MPLTLNLCRLMLSTVPPQPQTVYSRENFRDIQVKVHIRRPERDSWVYLGRGLVTQEVMGHSSRVGALFPQIVPSFCMTQHSTTTVVRTVSSGKVMTAFSEVRWFQKYLGLLKNMADLNPARRLISRLKRGEISL